MKKLLLILGVLLLTLPMMAQPMHKDKMAKEEMRKEMCSFKIKYLTQEMELNGDQNLKFSELYTRLEGERHKLFHERRQLEKKINQSRSASEEDYENALKSLNRLRDSEFELEKRYDAEFSRFLTDKQLFKLKKAEEEFRGRMLRMRHGKKNKK